MDTSVDVVVIGGGAAGLSAAVALGRSRRSVVVVDAGTPRNAPADGVHVYLGREGTPPAELVRIGRAEAQAYGVEIVEQTVVDARPVPGDGEPTFVVRLADGAGLRARRLVVASGLRDELPDVPGLAEQWGHGVLHCPYCHGYEVRDRRIGVLATTPMAGHQAKLFRQLSPAVTVLTHTVGALPAEEAELLARRDVRLVEGEVVAVESDGGTLTGVRLASGERVALDALAVATTMSPRLDGLEGLGLEVVEVEMGGHVFGTQVQASPIGATSVPGVWVAGNVSAMQAQVITAAAAGTMAGAQVNMELVQADFAAALPLDRRTRWLSGSALGDQLGDRRADPGLRADLDELQGEAGLRR